jgi:hypothetical protein
VGSAWTIEKQDVERKRLASVTVLRGGPGYPQSDAIRSFNRRAEREILTCQAAKQGQVAKRTMQTAPRERWRKLSDARARAAGRGRLKPGSRGRQFFLIEVAPTRRFASFRYFLKNRSLR